MAQFDVFANPDAGSVGDIPFLLDIQSDLLASLPSRAVLPLARKDALDSLPMLRLNPIFVVRDIECVVLTQDIAALPVQLLRTPVTTLSSQRDDILAALDFLFSGF